MATHKTDWIDRNRVLANGMTVGEALGTPGVPHTPVGPVPPSQQIEETLRDLELTPQELAEKSGLSIETINGLLGGTTVITREVAQGLAQADPSITPDGWMNCQRSYDKKMADIERDSVDGNRQTKGNSQ